MLAQRGLGYFIAAASNDADETADEHAAAAARDRDVVVDISALLISSVLGEFDYARGAVQDPAVADRQPARRHHGTQQNGRLVRQQRFSVSRPRPGHCGSSRPGHRRAPGRTGPLRETGAGSVKDPSRPRLLQSARSASLP